MNDLNGRLIYLLLLLPPLVAALTVHEFAHAWAGHKLGDDTARRQGRLTLDPLVHLDPFGSIMILLALFLNLPLLGWAKPVPFNPRNLSHPARDGMLIAIAGPISNLIQAAVWFVMLVGFRVAMGLRGFEFDPDTVLSVLRRQPDLSSLPVVFAAMMAAGVVVNIGLAAFNMLPLPPLDGHYVLEYLGPPSVAQFYESIRPFSFLILLVLLQTPFFRLALQPFTRFANDLVIRAFGLPPNLFFYVGG